MDLKISGKKSLVTGGCNGIGAEITKTLLEEGVFVTSTGRDECTGENFTRNLDDRFKSRFSFIKAELSDLNSINNFISNNQFDYDILVNNAGHTCDIKDPNCSIDEWYKVLNLNFLSCVMLTNKVRTYMSKMNWGRIVNITSCAGLENSGPITFTAAKAALTAYTRSMGRVLAIEDPNIVMTALYPGVINTKGGHWEKILKDNPEHAKKYLRERCPLGRFGNVEEFAPAVAFYCSELASFAHGSIVGFDGGQSKHFTQYNYEP